MKRSKKELVNVECGLCAEPLPAEGWVLVGGEEVPACEACLEQHQDYPRCPECRESMVDQDEHKTVCVGVWDRRLSTKTGNIRRKILYEIAQALCHETLNLGKGEQVVLGKAKILETTSFVMGMDLEVVGVGTAYVIINMKQEN